MKIKFWSLELWTQFKPFTNNFYVCKNVLENQFPNTSTFLYFLQLFLIGDDDSFSLACYLQLLFRLMMTCTFSVVRATLARVHLHLVQLVVLRRGLRSGASTDIPARFTRTLVKGFQGNFFECYISKHGIFGVLILIRMGKYASLELWSRVSKVSSSNVLLN